VVNWSESRICFLLDLRVGFATVRRNIVGDCSRFIVTLMPVIVATWEAEIRKIRVGSQPGQKAHETPAPIPTNI
jgi:hypothetical protein